MTRFSAAGTPLSPLQRAALAVRELRTRLDRIDGERREPIAIVGLGCRFPGAASSPGEFWQLLEEGREAVGEFPRDRWDVERVAGADPTLLATRCGSFVDRIADFDAAFFGISAREAESLDPQQRLLLEVTWEALEQGGFPPSQLRETRTGVFVGIGQNDYATRRLLSGDVAAIAPYDGTGNGFCFAAGRLSYLLGLQGPNLAVDTACSASLVAIHLACQSLRARECELALAGGVQLILSPEVTVFLARAGALSPDGRCRTFDAQASGFGRGEGCGVVVLKRLSDAVRDRDRIVAVIRGSAVNHDGPSSGLTVPSGSAQQRVIREALERAALAPDDIDYIEAHGTATSLGDPIEVGALDGVFGRRAAVERLRLGSVKTNIGHLEAAAGVAGLIKVALALEHERIPAHLHFTTPTPAVPWQRLPFRVTATTESWTRGERPRRAGVSAFGISGTNAHVIVEEAPVSASAPMHADAGPVVLRLATRDEAALRSLAGRIAAHIATHPAQLIEDICYTANVCRDDGPYRGAVVAADRTELTSRLMQLARGETGPRVKQGSAVERASSSPGGDGDLGDGAVVSSDRMAVLERAADAYVRGGSIDWRAMDGGAARTRVALPTYPWQRQRYWIESHNGAVAGRPADAAVLHPLLHRRIGSPVPRPEIEFETTLGPDHPLIAQHRVNGAAVLPAGAFIEMACAAAESAGLGRSSLEDCRFLRPLSVAAHVTIRIVVTPGADAASTFEIYSARDDGDAGWVRHVTGRLSVDATLPAAPLGLEDIVSRLTGTVDARALYRNLEQRGVELGAAFQVLGDIHFGSDEVLARLARSPQGEWMADPALLDGCSALYAVLFERDGVAGNSRAGADDVFVQSRVARVTVSSEVARACWAHVRRARGERRGDLQLLDAHGRVLARLEGQAFARATGDAPLSPARSTLYEVAWVPAPARDDAELGEEDRSYANAERALAQVSAGFAAAALREVNGGAPPSHIDVDELVSQGAVAPAYRGLLHRLIDIAIDAGAEVSDDPHASARAAQAQHPIAAAEFELVSRCGANLASVLRGTREPLSLLFPPQTAARKQVSARALYADSYAARVMNDQLRAAVSDHLARVQSPAPRVLEVGAGTGATTAALIEALPPGTEYWFTDIAPALVRQAQARLGGRSSLQFRTLDIEAPIDASEVTPGSFDLVVASNVLHATRSLADTLANVRGLLKPGGALVLLEGTSPRPWVDVIFGLTDGWWRFADRDVRSSHPLIPVAVWRRLLDESGFAAIAAYPETADGGPAGQSLIVASTGPLAAPATTATAARMSRQWVLVGDDGDFADALLTRMRSQGLACTSLCGNSVEEAAARAQDGVAFVFLAIAGGPGDAHPQPLPDRAHALVTDALTLVQYIKRAGQPCPIWFVTGGVEPAATLSPQALAQSPLWGIARTLALEEPRLWGGLVDLDPTESAAIGADRVIGEIARDRSGDDHVAYRAGARLVPRVRPLAASVRTTATLSDATFVITGGLGAFGLATARFLARRGVRHLYLTGRSGASSASARQALDDVAQLGAAPVVCAGDVTSDADMRAVLTAAQSAPAPLRGVIHAAGTTGWSLLSDLTPASVAEILGPKVRGAWVLHELTRHLDLQHFICYSSMVSAWAARGQGAYVAANQFLDTLAQHRRAAGLPAVTVNWGPLTGGGMMPAELAQDLQRMGVTSHPMDVAVETLDAILAHNAPRAIAVDIDWAAFRELYRSRRRTAMFDLVQAIGEPAATPAVVNAPSRAAVMRASPGQRRGVLLHELRALLAQVITTPSVAAIDTAAGLFDLGLDSLGAMELRRLLDQRFGVAFPSTILFERGTLEALAEDVITRLGLPVDEEAETPPFPAATVPGALLEAVTEQELESMLLRKLDELR